MPHEFRVRWQREGRNPTYRIYQSWNAAWNKVLAVQAMDAVKVHTERFADMPDLVGVPEIQVREVSEWGRNETQPSLLSERDVERMKIEIFYRYGEGAPIPRASVEDLAF